MSGPVPDVANFGNAGDRSVTIARLSAITVNGRSPAVVNGGGAWEGLVGGSLQRRAPANRALQPDGAWSGPPARPRLYGQDDPMPTLRAPLRQRLTIAMPHRPPMPSCADAILPIPVLTRGGEPVDRTRSRRTW